MKCFLLFVLTIIFCISCGKSPESSQKPSSASEITLVKMHNDMIKDIEFYTYMVRGPSKSVLSENKVKEFSAFYKEIDKAIETIEKEKKISPAEVSPYIVKNFVPEYSKVIDRMKSDALARSAYYGKVDKAKHHLRRIYTEFKLHVADQFGEIKVPTESELKKILGDGFKEMMTFPVNNKEYKIVQSGAKFTGNSSTEFATVRMNNGRDLVLYQNGDVKVTP